MRHLIWLSLLSLSVLLAGGEEAPMPPQALPFPLHWLVNYERADLVHTSEWVASEEPGKTRCQGYDILKGRQAAEPKKLLAPEKLFPVGTLSVSFDRDTDNEHASSTIALLRTKSEIAEYHAFAHYVRKELPAKGWFNPLPGKQAADEKEATVKP